MNAQEARRITLEAHRQLGEEEERIYQQIINTISSEAKKGKHTTTYWGITDMIAKRLRAEGYVMSVETSSDPRDQGERYATISW